MKSLHLLALFALVLVSVVSTMANEPIFDMEEMKFKAAYHRWAAHIYDNPRIMLSSSSRTYTGVPPFEEIVKLGKPAVPFIVAEMNKDSSDFGLFLSEAILRIHGWTKADFGSPISLQDLNAKITDRLRAEKIIPPTQKEGTKK